MPKSVWHQRVKFISYYATRIENCEL